MVNTNIMKYTNNTKNDQIVKFRIFDCWGGKNEQTQILPSGSTFTKLNPPFKFEIYDTNGNILKIIAN